MIKQWNKFSLVFFPLPIFATHTWQMSTFCLVKKKKERKVKEKKKGQAENIVHLLAFAVWQWKLSNWSYFPWKCWPVAIVTICFIQWPQKPMGFLDGRTRDNSSFWKQNCLVFFPFSYRCYFIHEILTNTFVIKHNPTQQWSFSNSLWDRWNSNRDSCGTRMAPMRAQTYNL